MNMPKLITKLKCYFDYHEYDKVIVFKSKNLETRNYTCRHCGDAYGGTFFGPVTLEISKDKK